MGRLALEEGVVRLTQFTCNLARRENIYARKGLVRNAWGDLHEEVQEGKGQR